VVQAKATPGAAAPPVARGDTGDQARADVAQPFAWALGTLGVAAGYYFASPVLAAVGVVGLVKGTYDWATAPTVESIPSVPVRYVLDEPYEPYYRTKVRDVELTGVDVRVSPGTSRGETRRYTTLETWSDRIDVDRTVEQETTYLAADVKIDYVRVPRGRRPTRYDPKQGDHTVAWTLMTYSLDTLAGWSAHNAIIELLQCCQELWKTPDQTAECLKKTEPIKRFSPNILGVQLPIERWQGVVSELIDVFLSANQLAAQATYSRTGKKTVEVKREDDAIRTLMAADDELRQRQRPTETAQELAEAAEGLLDVQFNPSLKVVHYAHAVRDWRRTMCRAFPGLMNDRTVGPVILGQVLGRTVPVKSRPDSSAATVDGLLKHYKL
jgi:hypothetical protein